MTSESALAGLEMSDISSVRIRCRTILLIADKLTSDF